MKDMKDTKILLIGFVFLIFSNSGIAQESGNQNKSREIRLTELPKSIIDSSPWISKDGLTLYYSRQKDQWSKRQIVYAKRISTNDAFENATMLLPGVEFSLTEDELQIVLFNEDGMLYTAFRPARDREFSSPEPLFDVRLDGTYRSPRISADGSKIYLDKFGSTVEPHVCIRVSRGMKWTLPTRVTFPQDPSGTVQNIVPIGSSKYALASRAEKFGSGHSIIFLEESGSPAAFVEPKFVELEGKSIQGCFPHYCAKSNELYFTRFKQKGIVSEAYILTAKDLDLRPLTKIASKADTGNGNNSEVNASATSLRAFAEKAGVHVGTCVNPPSFTGSRRDLVAREFNLIVSESHMKWDRIHPQKGIYNWKEADELVDFAVKNGMKIKGHTLVWYNSLPPYVSALSKDELRKELNEHIETIVKRYKGRVWGWDVVNEALDDTGGLRRSVFLDKLGPEYISDCFKIAHEADPDAVLIYNDYGCENFNKKSLALLNLVKDLKEKGVPLHEVGFQMHLLGNIRFQRNELKNNLNRFTQLGVTVNISELDILIGPLEGAGRDQKLVQQANFTRSILEECLAVDGFSGVTWWGFSDAHTWIHWLNRNNPKYVRESPLLFDEEYKPKPCYEAVIQSLKVVQKAR